eukprot:947995-Prorocentrum_minimum.AAC.1
MAALDAAGGDFTATNVSSLVVTAVSESEYTVAVTPSAVNAEVTLALADGAVTDAAGNGAPASNTLEVYYNALPVATLVSRSVDTYANTQSATFQFTANQVRNETYRRLSPRLASR